MKTTALPSGVSPGPLLNPLSRAFYQRPALTVARELLGKTLVCFDAAGRGPTGGIIVETEAYTGREDAACHSYKLDSPPPGHRTTVMFGPGGCAYVYLIYGMYCCFNVVTGLREGKSAEAVLVRALEPVLGVDLMAERRRTRDVKKLCSGPGKLCMALAIDRKNNGEPLDGEKLLIAEGPALDDVLATPRINVGYAGAAAELPFRFVVPNSPFLSTRKGIPKNA